MGQSNSPSENYLFLNVMVNFVIVNQKLTGSALHIEKNRTIQTVLKLFNALTCKELSDFRCDSVYFVIAFFYKILVRRKVNITKMKTTLP